MPARSPYQSTRSDWLFSRSATWPSGFGGLICLRRYWKGQKLRQVTFVKAEKRPVKKITYPLESLSPRISLCVCVYLGVLFLSKMADSGKMLEAPHSRVVPVQPAQSKPKKVHYPFWFGGSASCFAAAVTHPLDLGMFLFLPRF